MLRSSLRLLNSSIRCAGARNLVSLHTGSSWKSNQMTQQQYRNYVVLFHPPESDKKKLTAEEEEMNMELGDDYDEGEEVFSEEVDKFDDARFDFSTISYDNYIPGGNDIRSFLNEDDDHIDGGGDHFLTNEDQQEIDAAITYHGCDENYGFRLEHEKRKDKRRRIANRRKGLKSARKVYAMVSYLEMKKEYCATSWENADKDEDEEEGEEDTSSGANAGASAGARGGETARNARSRVN